MEGYRLSYFIDGESEIKGLPDHLFRGTRLDEGLKVVTDYLRTWIESDAKSESGIRTFHVSVIGPFPEERCSVDRRTPEEKFVAADSPIERADALCVLAESSLDAGQPTDAKEYIEKLQEILPDAEDFWNYAHTAAKFEILMGRLALQEGKVEDAKRHLMEAGQTNGSPTLNSFGPNMSLARDFLLVGERQIVLDYFNLCRKFWDLGDERLDIWEMYVNAGRIPDFEANLDY